MEASELLIRELRRLNDNLEAVINRPRYMKIPEASRELGIPEYKLRQMCSDGTLPAARTSNTGKNRHHMIDITAVRRVLNDGGYDVAVMAKSKYTK